MIDLAAGGENACLKWVTLLSDGSVLAGGVAYYSPVGDGIWLAKLTSQGVLDTSYGNNGYATHVLGEVCLLMVNLKSWQTIPSY